MFWRSLFPLIFIYTLVEGFVANLFYPAKLPLLYKDFLIGLVYFFFCLKEHVAHEVGELKRGTGEAAWLCAMAFAVVCFAQIFNPASPGLLLGVLGFKTTFFYW